MSNSSKYYVGLDLGTSSIGWAVVDESLRLIKKKGQNLWGARLFDEANVAKDRRTFRRQRRTINKRSWRLHLLQKELAMFVNKEDTIFFQRIKNSSLKECDFCQLFSGEYTDAQYHNDFPTIYHLRESLKSYDKSDEYKKRGIYGRLLFLAIHDILKNRGHFLINNSMQFGQESASLESIFMRIETLIEDKNTLFKFDLDYKIIKEMITKKTEKNDLDIRKKDINTLFVKLLIGRAISLDTLFESIDKIKVCFDDENWEELLPTNEEVADILQELFEIYRDIKINLILGESGSYSASRINIYNKHKDELRILKDDLLHIDIMLGTNYFNEIFFPFGIDLTSSIVDKDNISYANYVKKVSPKSKSRVSGKRTSKADLLAKLNKIRSELRKYDPTSELLSHIEEDGYLDVPNNSDNRLIPYQAHMAELTQILSVFKQIEKVSYNEDELSEIIKHIKKLLEFKVPYYVGPLGKKGENSWLVKNEGFEGADITPYNINSVVNKEKTNEAFMKRMLRHCTFLDNEYCLQQETLTYQRYIFFNTISPMKINDTYLTYDQKIKLYNFVIGNHALTKNGIIRCLGLQNDVEISGFSKDDNKPLPLSLSAEKKFRRVFPTQIDNPFYRSFFDQVINDISLLDKSEKELRVNRIKMLSDEWTTVFIDDSQIESLSNLSSSKWGNLSKKLLLELKFVDQNGEYRSMLDIIEQAPLNLMQVLYSYDNQQIVDKENGELADINSPKELHEYLKKRYIAPQPRRTIIQANKILDEIVEIMGAYPDRIAIEFTREDKEKKMTDSRYYSLMNIYHQLQEDYHDIIEELKKYEHDADGLRARDIYLYFTQLGKDMYTGKPIDLNRLKNKNIKEYDRDHIWPQSLIKDDSLDNLVLSNVITNQEIKKNFYPVPVEIRQKMKPFWELLLKKGLISSKKYDRLTSQDPISDYDLENFVNRQKTTLDWANKETAEILNKRFNRNNFTQFIIYSKSRIVSEYRHEIDLHKFRELNNLHHAHDALLNIALSKTLQEHLNFQMENKRYTYNYLSILKKYLGTKYSKYLSTVFQYKNIFVTKKLEIKNTGPYWDQMIIPASNSKDEVHHEIKNGLSVSEYGGYNKVSTAFFSIIENSKGKLEIIQVPIVDCSKFYDDDQFNLNKFEKYIQLSSKASKLIYPILPINHKVLVNGVPMRVAGKSGNSILYHLSTELMLPNDLKEYLRRLFSIQRKNIKLDFSESQWLNYEVTNSYNARIFEYISNHLLKLGENKLYPENTYIRLQSSKNGNPLELFNGLSIKEQVQILITIMTKLVKANNSNQGKLFGVNYVDYSKSSVLIYPFSVIKESITGFYTKKIIICSEQ